MVEHEIIDFHFATPSGKDKFTDIHFDIPSDEDEIDDFQFVTPSGELNIGIYGLKLGEIQSVSLKSRKRQCL